METDNLACDTFEAQRLVCDHVHGIQNINMKNKQLLSSCSNARHKYHAFLDQKKEQAKAASAGKRKAVNDEVHQLKKRKKDLVTQESLLTSADEYADKAEKEHNATFIAKSNA